VELFFFVVLGADFDQKHLLKGIWHRSECNVLFYGGGISVDWDWILRLFFCERMNDEIKT
jgi:hypothetical protein